MQSFVAVEAIGAGKTTVLKILKKLMPDAQVLDEPVEDWTQRGCSKKCTRTQNGLLWDSSSPFSCHFHAYHRENARWSSSVRLGATSTCFATAPGR